MRKKKADYLSADASKSRLTRRAAVTRAERNAHLERANAVLSNTIEDFALEQSPDAFLDAMHRGWGGAWANPGAPSQ